jgi:hypothetical protein
LADFVRVEGADLRDGLLSLELVREIPDAMKPARSRSTAGFAHDRQLQPQRGAERAEARDAGRLNLPRSRRSSDAGCLYLNDCRRFISRLDAAAQEGGPLPRHEAGGWIQAGGHMNIWKKLTNRSCWSHKACSRCDHLLRDRSGGSGSAAAGAERQRRSGPGNRPRLIAAA